MTQKQIANTIKHIIDEFDFSDFTHNLSLLINEVENNEITVEDYKEEVKEIFTNEFGLFGETIADRFIKVSLDHTE